MKHALLPLLRELALDLLDGKLYFDNYGPEAFCMRTLLAIGALQNYYREELSSRKPPLLKELVALVDQMLVLPQRAARLNAPRVMKGSNKRSKERYEKTFALAAKSGGADRLDACRRK